MITPKSTAAMSSRAGSTISDFATMDSVSPRSSSCVRSTCASVLNYAPPQLPNVVQTMKDVEHLDPGEVQSLMEQRQCVLVDVRGEDRASGIIAGSIHEPAVDSDGSVSFPTKVSELVEKWKDKPLIVFTCQYSAHRAPQCANWYREKAPLHQRVAIMSMGFRGWEGLGFPVQEAATGMLARAIDSQQLGSMFVTNCLTLPTALPQASTIPQTPKEGWSIWRFADNLRCAFETSVTPPRSHPATFSI